MKNKKYFLVVVVLLGIFSFLSLNQAVMASGTCGWTSCEACTDNYCNEYRTDKGSSCTCKCPSTVNPKSFTGNCSYSGSAIYHCFIGIGNKCPSSEPEPTPEPTPSPDPCSNDPTVGCDRDPITGMGIACDVSKQYCKHLDPTSCYCAACDSSNCGSEGTPCNTGQVCQDCMCVTTINCQCMNTACGTGSPGAMACTSDDKHFGQACTCKQDISTNDCAWDKKDCFDGLGCVAGECVQPSCGDFVITPPEVCDPPNNNGCSSDCKSQTSPPPPVPCTQRTGDCEGASDCGSGFKCVPNPLGGTACACQSNCDSLLSEGGCSLGVCLNKQNNKYEQCVYVPGTSDTPGMCGCVDTTSSP